VGRRDGNQKNRQQYSLERASPWLRTVYTAASIIYLRVPLTLGTSFLSAIKIANEDFLVP
jgi:hypothetical protein